jgi:hypothetical protein
VGGCVEGEDLVERAVGSDEAPQDQRRAGLEERGAGQGHALTEGRVDVVTEALGICHGDQKESEGAGRMAELSERTLTDQALSHPAARPGNASEFGQRKRALVQPGGLRGDRGNPTSDRAPMVAAGGRWWRGHLVTAGRLTAR